MENNELLKPLYEIVDRVKELVQLAKAEEWEAMDSAANKYQQHVTFLDDDVYLQAINDAHLVEEAKAIIVQIQNLNDDLDVHTNIQRERIASELRQMNQSDRALEAYGR
ncbi:MAG: flagellar protein FliT [Moraxellaceae bacterium]|nr:MAG: flagellar protein FliT [Moraxellaceae bacterium]